MREKQEYKVVINYDYKYPNGSVEKINRVVPVSKSLENYLISVYPETKRFRKLHICCYEKHDELVTLLAAYSAVAEKLLEAIS